MTRNVAVCNTVADSYLAETSVTAGALAEAAAARKTVKYIDIMPNYLFCPVSIETLGPICSESHTLIQDTGKRNITSDPREAAFLYQRISMSVNAAF